ncbi:MAG: electron transfer flavoprotein subunit alpha/FixB family protein [Acidobacteriota bacterium]|nr:electron transfer flavoprotein subunit alpha/FixB family protein [Acidobacteriota bacterium]MDH3522830.1 electron transfer flavoprotein subunit alpha/FixB family protein [Acidobacteriota bacterium]
MAKVWIVVQHRDGKLHRMSREAVAAGQALAAALGGRGEAVLLGSGVDAVAAALAGYDLDAVHVADAPALADYTPGGYAGVLAAAVAAHGPSHLVFAHTYQSVEYMARLAHDVGGSLVPEIVSFEGDSEGIVWTRPVLGGKLTARVRATGPSPVLVSVQSGSFAADDAVAGSAEPCPLDASAAAVDREILGVEAAAEGEQIDLTAAEIIVAVGRGVGGADKMGAVEELAKALGAEIGASRPVIDGGWLERDRQIGSSGQTVAPKLYVALGISGAIQHLVGMKGSGTIVAINKDAGAPIFGVARYGIAGDLHEVVPELTAAILAAKEAAG